METRNSNRIEWGTFAATATALFTFLWFVWTVSPDQWKIASTVVWQCQIRKNRSLPVVFSNDYLLNVPD